MSKIFIAFSIVSVNDCILVVRENDNLAGEVYRQFYPAPHVQVNLTVDNLNPVMHTVQIWTTSDGSTLESLSGECSIDASISTTTTSIDILTFIVDRGFTDPDDPVDSSTQYVNPAIDNKNFVPFKPGFGAIVEGTHWQKIVGGGFELTDGQVFNSQEEWTVMVINDLTTVVTTGGGGAGYPSGIVEITVDTNIDPVAHRNKLLMPYQASGILTLSITDIAMIPDNFVFGITTHLGAGGSSQRYVALSVVGASLNWFNTARGTIWLGKGETIVLIKNQLYLIPVSYSGDGARVGERVQCDGTPPLNSIPETGWWLLKTDYPRLFNLYVNLLPPSELGTGTQDILPDDSNKSKWIITATKFWVPDTRDFFYRNSDGTRKSGERQDEEVGPHFHDSGTNTVQQAEYLRSPIDHPRRNWNVGNSTTDGPDSTDMNKRFDGFGYAEENRPKNVTRNWYIII